ncbi:MAG: IS66 family transposase zinc-finger binding domain-containing protein [Rhizomicrobium sp.]
MLCKGCSAPALHPIGKDKRERLDIIPTDVVPIRAWPENSAYGAFEAFCDMPSSAPSASRRPSWFGGGCRGACYRLRLYFTPAKLPRVQSTTPSRMSCCSFSSDSLRMSP